MTDLLTDPEAQKVNPAEARRIAQMEAEIARLQPKAKPSTTSYVSAGDGGATPIRVSDLEERRRTIAAITPTFAPNPWDAYEENWKAKDEAYEKEKQDQQAALRQADERRLAEVNAEIARKKRKQEFDNQEAVIDLALADLTTQERGRVKQRMLNEGKTHDADLAMAYAMEVKYARGNQPVEDKPLVDWRDIIKRRKK
jgi:hypothetical protein